jgi:hypothetical protein
LPSIQSKRLAAKNTPSILVLWFAHFEPSERVYAPFAGSKLARALLVVRRTEKMQTKKNPAFQRGSF